ncbi:MAG: oxidoreductase, partial [Planctomycetota bacterium]
MKRHIALLVACAAGCAAPGGEPVVGPIDSVVTGSDASLRGLAAVSADACWATGSDATVLRTADGGRTWTNVAPDSIAGLDVRDVEATSVDTAWILCAGPGDASRILMTRDGGTTWSEQHREAAEEAFLDGLAFWSPQRGMAYGDPLGDGRFRVLVTGDGGSSWVVRPGPMALVGGEAGFAASGTGIRTLGSDRAWIVTGANDATARVLATEDGGASWTAHTTPLAAAKPGAGAFSVAMAPDGRGVVVGGDYLQRELGGTSVAAWTDDFGATWNAPTVGPRGQRAGSAWLGGAAFVATGQTGTDVSYDGGRTWEPWLDEGFHCVDVARGDGTIWLAGPNGRIARRVQS